MTVRWLRRSGAVAQWRSGDGAWPADRWRGEECASGPTAGEIRIAKYGVEMVRSLLRQSSQVTREGMLYGKRTYTDYTYFRRLARTHRLAALEQPFDTHRARGGVEPCEHQSTGICRFRGSEMGFATMLADDVAGRIMQMVRLPDEPHADLRP